MFYNKGLFFILALFISSQTTITTTGALSAFQISFNSLYHVCYKTGVSTKCNAIHQCKLNNCTSDFVCCPDINGCNQCIGKN